MSTKIYNGYKVNASMLELYSKLKSLVPKIKAKADEVFAIHVAMVLNTTAVVDCSTRKILEAEGEVIDAFDLDDESLVLYPISDELTLVQDYTSSFINVSDLIKKELGLVEYAYWDNTDKPDNVSEEAWVRRREVWNKAVSNYGLPALSGFVFNFVLKWQWGVDYNLFRNKDWVEKMFRNSTLEVIRNCFGV